MPTSMRQTESGEWQEVDPDEGVSEGDLIRTYHCVQAPSLLDNEVFARLSVETTKLTGQLNNDLPECIDAEVRETEIRDGQGVVVDGDECEFLYVTTMKVTNIEPGCENFSTSSLAGYLLVALAAVAVLVGISLVLWRAEKFISSPGGEEIGRNVSLALLLAAAGWAFLQFKGSDSR